MEKALYKEVTSQIFEKSRKASKAKEEKKEKAELFEDWKTEDGVRMALKKVESIELTRRKALVEPGQNKFSLRKQCELLGIDKSGLYYKPRGPRQEDLELMKAI